MTQPDDFFPTGAANYASLAEFAGRLQEDWEALMRDPVDFTFDRILSALFEGIQEGISFTLAILSAIVKAIFNLDPTTFFADVESALAELGPIGAFLVTIGEGVADFLDALGQSTLAAAGSLLATLWSMVMQISDIFNGVAVTPINTAVQQVKDWWTTVGEALPDVASAIQNTIIAAGGTLTGGLAAAGTVLGGAVQTAGVNAQGVINGVNNAAAGLLSGGSALLADAVSNFSALFGGAPQYLQGLSGESSQQATNDAYAAAAQAQAAMAADAARQQSAFNAVFNVSPAGNVNVTVDFTGIPDQAGMSGVMLPGSGSGTGYMGVTSGAAAWQGGTGGDVEVFPTATDSDYQIIDVTLGNLNDLLSGDVRLNIPFRVNSARDTFCYLTLYATSGVVYAELAATVGGFGWGYPPVKSAAGALSAISSGGKFRIFAGDPGSNSPYAFQITYSGTPILTFTDSSNVSQIGAGQRYVGLYQYVTTNGKYPPAVRSVTYQDNPPVSAAYPYSGLPDAGTKGRVYWPNDVGLALRDNGSSWETIWGGTLSAFTPPPAFPNQIGFGGTFTTDKGSRSLAIATGAFNWNIEYDAISPASNYICRAYFEALPYLNDDNFNGPSIVLYDSSSGKFIAWGYAYDPSNFKIQAGKWNSSTSWNSNYVNLNVADVIGYGINWWQIRDDGTNRYFEYSFNGVDFHTAGSSIRTDFITPTHIGWGAGRYSVAFQHRLRSWKHG